MASWNSCVCIPARSTLLRFSLKSVMISSRSFVGLFGPRSTNAIVLAPFVQHGKSAKLRVTGYDSAFYPSPFKLQFKALDCSSVKAMVQVHELIGVLELYQFWHFFSP